MHKREMAFPINPTLMSTYYLVLLPKGKVFTSSFFDTCLPLGIVVKNGKGTKGVT